MSIVYQFTSILINSMEHTPHQTTQQPSPSGQSHIFPSYADQPKKGSKAKTVLPIALSIALLLGTLVIANNEFGFVDLGGATQPTPTPAPTSAPAESPTPAASVNKEDVTIDIFNGSGVTGQAGTIQSALEAADYTQITVGNADDTVDTTIQYGPGIGSDIIDEIEAILTEAGLNPTSEMDDSIEDNHVVITTGSEGRAAAVEDEEDAETPTPAPTSTEASGSAQ
jgi:hypothetical protein